MLLRFRSNELISIDRSGYLIATPVPEGIIFYKDFKLKNKSSISDL
jgi:hypothetical protein